MTENTVRSSRWKWLGFFLGVAAAGMLVHLVLTTAAWAQGRGALRANTRQANIGTVRTVHDMLAFDAAHPDTPVAMSPSLPTMNFGQYRAAKAAAAADVGPQAGLAPSPAAPPTPGTLTCSGIDQTTAGGSFPPDTHGAVGPAHIGQIVNSTVRFYTKALSGGPVPPVTCPAAIAFEATLAAFFGYENQPLFDPRLVYDLASNRWIVSAEAFPESPTFQLHFIGVSSDTDPTHFFITYQFNMAAIVGTGVFWDYPQIGYDRDSIILTGNKFKPSSGDPNEGGTYVGSTVVFFKKSLMYAAMPATFCSFSGGPLNIGTIAPPIVLDAATSPYTTLAVAAPGTNYIRVTKWNPTGGCPTFITSNDIATQTFVPGPAKQLKDTDLCPLDNAPNSEKCFLDTLDGRFQSASTQLGSSPVEFWQVRTHGARGRPRPVTYQVNADTSAIEQTCSLFASGTSFDFNPSIVANEAKTIFVTWSSTDPTNNHNAQVRASGKLSGDPCGVLNPGNLVIQSTTLLTTNFDPNIGLQRWGDYSAITLDPSDHTIAYGVNETILNRGAGWGSYIFNMHNP